MNKNVMSCMSSRVLHCIAIVVVQVVALAICSSAQSAPNSPANLQVAESLKSQLEDANQLVQSDQYEQAQQILKEASTQATAQNDQWAQAETKRLQGLLFLGTVQLKAAESSLKEALATFMNLGDALGAARAKAGLGKLALYMANFNEAQQLYKEAFTEFDGVGAWRDKATALLDLSRLHNGKGNDNSVGEGMELARRLNDRRLEARFTLRLGQSDFMRGDFAQAQEKYDQAGAAFEEFKDRRYQALALVYVALLQLRYRNSDEALELCRRAFQIQEEAGDKIGMVATLNAMGKSYQVAEKHKQSLGPYERALALARETGARAVINHQLEALASAYLLLHENAKTIYILEELAKDESDPYLVAYHYQTLGFAYQGTGDFKRALEYADKGLQAAQETHNLELIPHILSRRALAKQKLGMSEEALADVYEALAGIEEFRKKLSNSDFVKRGFGDRFQEYFGIGIQILQEQGRYEQALWSSEQGRARAFLDLLASRELQVKSADQSQFASLAKSHREAALSKMDDAAPFQEPVTGMRLRGGNDAGSHRTLTSDAGADLESIANATPLSSAEMKRTAKRLNSTILSYWVDADSTFIWVVHPDGRIQGKIVNVSSQKLTQLVRQTFKAPDTQGRGLSEEAADDTSAGQAAEADSARFTLPTRSGDVLVVSERQKQAWRELYGYLITPVEAWLPTAPRSLLTVVPHGPLLLLSFAALQDESGNYLLEKYALHYAPAISVLQFTEHKKHQSTVARKFLFVADPNFVPSAKPKEALPELPGSKREVKMIAGLLPAREVTMLTGKDAEEQRVREAMKGKTVIHFATHGILQNDQPMNSFLALGSASQNRSSSSDGRLTAEEIYGLDLNADLVVLSACRTASGKISGDGIIGLTRALFYAGAPSVVASLWDVADEPTVHLMPEFYRSWEHTHDKSRALRAAQLHLLRDLRKGKIEVSTATGTVVLPENPIFWAGFVLQGEP